MDTNPNSRHPKILGNAKLLASKLITKYGKRESDSIAKILTEFVTEKPYIAALVDSEAVFTPQQFIQWEVAISRLLAGEPIQYVTEKAWFRDLEILIRPGALIPRPETEELVDWVIKKLQNIPSPKIIDVGTGSGCLALSLSSEISGASVTAIDVSPNAVEIAKENASRLRLPVNILLVDVLLASDDTFSNFDCIVCNPPYIPRSESSEMEAHVIEHEPALALFVDDLDPLLFYNKVSQLGLHWLKPNGWLFFEIHENFGKEVIELMKDLGYQQVSLKSDLSGRDRMVAGMLPI